VSRFREDGPVIEKILKFSVGVVEIVGNVAHTDRGAKLARLFERLRCGDQFGHSLARVGDEDFVSALDLLEELGEVGFGLMDVVGAGHEDRLAKGVD